jgi:type IV pilus assembly protein PilM
MPKSELNDAIKLTAKNYFPFSIENALLDFQILDEIVEKGVKKYQLLVATSPKETVNRYLTLLDKVNIKSSSFIPISLALQKVIENITFQKDEVNAFLELGKQFSELIIFREKQLLFSRKIPVAGEDFTKVMTGALVSDRGRTELSLEEAEKIKCEVGIPVEGESKMLNDKVSTVQILSMIRATAEQLANEIERCFDYYREEFGAGGINRLILLGGAAYLKRLREFLSQELGIEVILGNPLDGIKSETTLTVDKDQTAHRLSLAIGAGLTEAKGINLLPPEIKEETKRVVKRGTLEAIAITIALILVFVYVGMRIQLGNFQKRNSVAKLELSSLQPQLKQAEDQNLSNIILKDEPYWEDVFKELSNIIPSDIYLSELSMENKNIKMRGLAVSKDSEESVSKFILALEKGIFKNVNLVTSKKLEDKTGNEFELRCLAE